MNSDELNEAILMIDTDRRLLSRRFFELTVRDAWLESLKLMCKSALEVGGEVKPYRDNPVIPSRLDRSFLGGQALLCDARRHARHAYNEHEMSDDRFKQLVEVLLVQDLQEHGMVLLWETRFNWDGQERVLSIYHESEELPPES